MQVSKIQNNQPYYSNNISFSAVTNFERILPANKGILSKKSVKLINDLNACIDREWSDIRKGKLISLNPKFRTEEKGKLITFEPIYTQKYPALLIDINDGKISQKILMNRDNPNNFRYEKVIATDHGSATLKSYNSINGNNKEINEYVNNIIEKNLNSILSHKMWDRILNRLEEAMD